MHAVLVSIGTDGDIFPYVGLGAVLRARGHRVTLVASEHYEPLAQRHGFGFRALVSTAENKALFEHPDFWNPFKTAVLSARWGLRFVRRQYDLLASLAAPGTVLIANPAVFAASLVHEKLGVPTVNLIPQPWLILSADAPSAMPYLTLLTRAPRPIWSLCLRGMEFMGDRIICPELNRIRATLGLKPVHRIFRNWLSRELVLGIFPDWFGLPQADWPRQIRCTGFPLYDGGQSSDLAPELSEFCRAGEPPVAFTFGSGMAHSAELFRTALEACAILSRRAIVLTKYRNQLPAVLPATVRHCSFAPFQRLFPLCAAVVHHGGIGTVAEALAAGTPQLIRPICFDQADNGARVKRLGVGDCLPSGHSNGRMIAAALRPLLTEKVRLRGRELAARFDRTKPLETAADLVEGMGQPDPVL